MSNHFCGFGIVAGASFGAALEVLDRRCRITNGRKSKFATHPSLRLRRPDDLAPARTPVAWKDSEMPGHALGIRHRAWSRVWRPRERPTLSRRELARVKSRMGPVPAISDVTPQAALTT
jgi:hypothetical protein